MIILCIFVWIVTGIAWLIYDWTSQHDATAIDLVMCIVCGTAMGLLAPIITLIPKVIGKNSSRVVIKKRVKK